MLVSDNYTKQTFPKFVKHVLNIIQLVTILVSRWSVLHLAIFCTNSHLLQKVVRYHCSFLCIQAGKKFERQTDCSGREEEIKTTEKIKR